MKAVSQKETAKRIDTHRAIGMVLIFALLWLILPTVTGAVKPVVETIDICHRTASNQNPYVVNSPNKSADVGGHDGHDGPIWFSGIAVPWGDIIPPFYYNNGQDYYPGKNWTAVGEAIYKNECVIPTTTPTPTPTPTPTITPTPTVSPTPSVSPTPTPSVSPTPTPSGNPTPTPSISPTPTPTVAGSTDFVDEPDCCPGPDPVVPTATPSPAGKVLGTTKTETKESTAQVLGATTLADTGGLNPGLAISVIGCVSTLLGIKKWFGR